MKDDECLSCGEVPEGECPESKRPCGHHCNHSWTHDECHWCGADFDEEAMFDQLEADMASVEAMS